MENNTPGIDGTPYKITLPRDSLGTIGVSLKVLSDPESCIIKSKWKLINWWRRITDSEERGYTYTVKIVDK